MAGTVVRGSVLLTPKFDNLGANVKRALGSGYKSAVSVTQTLDDRPLKTTQAALAAQLAPLWELYQALRPVR